MTKYEHNPILTPQDVIPTSADLKVDGVFNCAAIRYQEEYLLLCRVAESFSLEDKAVVKIPVVVNENGHDCIQQVIVVKEEHPEYDFSDSRSITKIEDGQRKIIYLTSLSHLRLARSKDGYNFTIDEKPTIFPQASDEAWGMEDPRITQIGDTFYINYTSVSRNGAATSLITTKDFVTFERQGIIFAPENKDVTIFPEKINGHYMCFNRPVPKAIGAPDMWIAYSDNLRYWGNQKYFYGVTDDSSWENGRIGGGAVPFRTEKGWIKIYHAADKNNKYCLGAFLLDKDDPSIILGKTAQPILEPTEAYECDGFFSNVVFTCGCIVENDTINIYYGAADDKVCLAQMSLQKLLALLG